MALMDYIQTAVEKVMPPKSGLPRPVGASGMGKGIGNTMGVAEFEDEMIISKPAIIFHISQSFLSFLAMCCFASVAAFQAKWGVGPSGLSGFAIFISIVGILLPLFMMLVPVVDVKYGKLTRLSRALSEIRVGFILSGTGTTLTFLIAFITAISAWSEAGCKNPKNDPHAKEKGDGFTNGLSGWCTTKKAGSIFFWLAFGFWLASLTLNILNWRNGKSTNPRDPPFQAPIDGDEAGHYDEIGEEDEERSYGQVPPTRANFGAADSPFSDSAAVNRQSQASSSYTLPPVSGVGGFDTPSAGSTGAGAIPAPRSSIDAYGAFSDPAPSGFGNPAPVNPFSLASGLSSSSPSGVSRTMQYADPYAAVRTSIASGVSSVPVSIPGSTSPVRAPAPPSYSEYTGYR